MAYININRGIKRFKTILKVATTTGAAVFGAHLRLKMSFSANPETLIQTHDDESSPSRSIAPGSLPPPGLDRRSPVRPVASS